MHVNYDLEAVIKQK